MPERGYLHTVFPRNHVPKKTNGKKKMLTINNKQKVAYKKKLAKSQKMVMMKIKKLEAKYRMADKKHKDYVGNMRSPSAKKFKTLHSQQMKYDRMTANKKLNDHTRLLARKKALDLRNIEDHYVVSRNIQMEKLYRSKMVILTQINNLKHELKDRIENQY